MADPAQKKRRASSSKGGSRSRPSPSPPPSPPLTCNQVFSNDEQYERFAAHFFERPILEGKYLDNAFSVPGEFEFYDILRQAGLTQFVGFRRHYYPELVRVFYSNMRISESGIIRSEVKQVKMAIKPSLFHKLTSIPCVGVPFEGHVVDEWKEEYNSVTARQMVCKPDPRPINRLTAGRMKFECRLLHYVICRILLPRSTNVAQAKEEDIILIWAMMNSREINLGHVIRNRMKRATRDNAQLPYPHLITTILEHFGVPIETDPFVEVKDRQRIGYDVMTSMGYEKNAEGVWVYKDDVNIDEEEDNEEAHDGNEEEHERQSSPIPDESSSATLTEVMTQIRDLHMFLANRLDTIEGRVQSVEEQIINLRNERPSNS